jgi:hypothetical protein
VVPGRLIRLQVHLDHNRVELAGLPRQVPTNTNQNDWNNEYCFCLTNAVIAIPASQFKMTSCHYKRTVNRRKYHSNKFAQSERNGQKEVSHR